MRIITLTFLNLCTTVYQACCCCSFHVVRSNTHTRKSKLDTLNSIRFNQLWAIFSYLFRFLGIQSIIDIDTFFPLGGHFNFSRFVVIYLFFFIFIQMTTQYKIYRVYWMGKYQRRKKTTTICLWFKRRLLALSTFLAQKKAIWMWLELETSIIVFLCVTSTFSHAITSNPIKIKSKLQIHWNHINNLNGFIGIT